MGNGQFGIYFVGTPPASEGIQTDFDSNVPRDYERVLYKVGRFPYSPDSTTATPLPYDPSSAPSPLSHRRSLMRQPSRVRSKSVGASYERNDLSYIGRRPFHSTTIQRSLFPDNKSPLASCGCTNLNNDYPGTRSLGQKYGGFVNYADFRLNTSKSSPPNFDIRNSLLDNNDNVLWKCPCSRNNNGNDSSANSTDNSKNNDGSESTPNKNSNGGNTALPTPGRNNINGGDQATGPGPTNQPKGSQTDPPPWILYDNVNDGKFMAVGGSNHPSPSPQGPPIPEPGGNLLPIEAYNFVPPGLLSRPPPLSNNRNSKDQQPQATPEWSYSKKDEPNKKRTSISSETQQPPLEDGVKGSPQPAQPPQLTQATPTTTGRKSSLDNKSQRRSNDSIGKRPSTEDPAIMGTGIGTIRTDPPNPFGKPRLFAAGYPQLQNIEEEPGQGSKRPSGPGGSSNGQTPRGSLNRTSSDHTGRRNSASSTGKSSSNSNLAGGKGGNGTGPGMDRNGPGLGLGRRPSTLSTESKDFAKSLKDLIRRSVGETSVAIKPKPSREHKEHKIPEVKEKPSWVKPWGSSATKVRPAPASVRPRSSIDYPARAGSDPSVSSGRSPSPKSSKRNIDLTGKPGLVRHPSAHNPVEGPILMARKGSVQRLRSANINDGEDEDELSDTSSILKQKKSRVKRTGRPRPLGLLPLTTSPDVSFARLLEGRISRVKNPKQQRYSIAELEARLSARQTTSKSQLAFGNRVLQPALKKSTQSSKSQPRATASDSNQPTRRRSIRFEGIPPTPPPTPPPK